MVVEGCPVWISLESLSKEVANLFKLFLDVIQFPKRLYEESTSWAALAWS